MSQKLSTKTQKLSIARECTAILKEEFNIKMNDSDFSKLKKKNIFPIHKKEDSSKDFFIVGEFMHGYFENLERISPEEVASYARYLAIKNERGWGSPLNDVEKIKQEVLKASTESPEIDISFSDIKLEDMTLNEARLQKEYWIGKKAELDYKKNSGELVSVEEVRKDAFEAGRMIRDGFHNMSHKLSLQIAGISEPKKIELMIEKEVLEILEHLSTDEKEF